MATEISRDYEEAIRLSRQFALCKSRGDRAAALILRGRIERWYETSKLMGFWREFASDWFVV